LSLKTLKGCNSLYQDISSLIMRIVGLVQKFLEILHFLILVIIPIRTWILVFIKRAKVKKLMGWISNY